MIFQDPMTSLNPYLTVERQMTEVLEFHKGMSRKEARVKAIQALDAVKMPEAARRVAMYPHEFSGGMRQRVMIAMALLCEPDVLIADEPTGNLDTRTSVGIMGLLQELNRTGITVVLVTHEPDVAGYADRRVTFVDGRIVQDERTGRTASVGATAT